MADIFFTILTPLNFAVRTTRQYWQLIQRKHPEIIGKEADVQHCLRTPEQVRQSKQDHTVYLFYRLLSPGYYVVVVTKRLDGEGFMITSYVSDKVKEGETVWPISV